MKTILYVITKSNFGGAQRYVFDLATSLDKKAFNPIVALGGAGMLKDLLEKAGVKTLSLPSLGRDVSLIKDFSTLWDLCSIIRAEKPHILHLNSSKIGLLGGLVGRLFRVKKILFTAHGWAFHEDRGVFVKISIKILSWLTVLLSHRTIAVSQHDALSFKLWPFVNKKLIYIPNGIRPIDALEREGARLKLQVEYHVDAKLKLIGTISELHKNKGLSYLIKATKNLPNDISLCIIGDGEKKEELQKLAKEIGVEKRIFFTGFIQNPSRFLKAFDVFVLPSIKEGLPYVLLEAGLAGLPVVASNIGGIPDIIKGGVTGTLVEPKNPGEINTALSNYLKNPDLGTQHGNALRKKVKTEFNFESKTLKKTLKTYEF